MLGVFTKKNKSLFHKKHPIEIRQLNHSLRLLVSHLNKCSLSQSYNLLKKINEFKNYPDIYSDLIFKLRENQSKLIKKEQNL